MRCPITAIRERPETWICRLSKPKRMRIGGVEPLRAFRFDVPRLEAALFLEENRIVRMGHCSPSD